MKSNYQSGRVPLRSQDDERGCVALFLAAFVFFVALKVAIIGFVLYLAWLLVQWVIS